MNTPCIFPFVVSREGVKEMILRPHVFHCRPEFLMIWGVYAATYVTANMIMTTCDRSKVDDTWPKFIGTTFVNITTVVAKVSTPEYNVVLNLWLSFTNMLRGNWQ